MDNIIKHYTSRKSVDVAWPNVLLEEISCPLCKSRKWKKIYPAHYARIVRCKLCDFAYTNPRLKARFLKRLYSEGYFKNNNSHVIGYADYVKDEENITKTFLKRLAMIEKHVKKGRLLDVGCATGFFLNSARENGWSVEGVEVSDFAADFARKKFDLQIYVGDIEKINLPKNRYDLITMWDVIEHIVNPIKVLKHLRASLTDNGILVMTTPDEGSIPARITKHKWVGYKLSDEHLAYFSKKTMINLLEQTGFSMINSHQVGKYVHFSLFANRVGMYSKLAGTILNLFGKLLPQNSSLYISAYDIMCVYASRR